MVEKSERPKDWQGLFSILLMLSARVPSPSLIEMCTEAANRKDIMQFCNSIIFSTQERCLW